ncbi:MAG: hypothetical protein ACRENA_08865, partial [Vulcanimicrobiaceae bacterium]
MQSANATGTASFSIAVPGAAAATTLPQSLVVTLLQVNGASPSSKAVPYTMNLTIGTKTCVSQAGGALSCTATVSAPPGNDMFALTTYSGV